MKNIGKKIKNWYSRIYGVDELGYVLIIGYVVLLAVSVCLMSSGIYILANTSFIMFIFRFFSLNHILRSKENMALLRCKNLWKLRFKERKHSRIFVCAYCGNFLRVPKKRGKIRITCPVCHRETVKRT